MQRRHRFPPPDRDLGHDNGMIGMLFDHGILLLQVASSGYFCGVRLLGTVAASRLKGVYHDPAPSIESDGLGFEYPRPL